MWWYLPWKLYGGKTTRTIAMLACLNFCLVQHAYYWWHKSQCGGICHENFMVAKLQELLNFFLVQHAYYWWHNHNLTIGGLITMWWYLPWKVYGGKTTRTIAMLACLNFYLVQHAYYWWHKSQCGGICNEKFTVAKLQELLPC